MTLNVQTLKQLGARGEDLAQKALTALGLGQPESRIVADAQSYWSTPSAKRWTGNSHWQGADVFRDSDLWGRMGAKHVEMFERGARAANFDRPLDRVVDWGCGGGANAVAFSRLCKEIIGVDISKESLAECHRQLADTPVHFSPVHIKVANPESALDLVGEIDAFLCYYVLELVPSPPYGLRLMKIAHDMLTPGGIAHVQIKYSTRSLATRPRGRNYLRGQAQMATYEIHEFWEAMQTIGFTVVMSELVPRNELDVRYAYYTLIKN